MCTVQWCQVKSERTVQTALKKEAYAESFIKYGWKLKKRQPNNPIGFFVHCPVGRAWNAFHSCQKKSARIIIMLMIISCKTFFKSMLISEYPKPNMDLFWEVLFRQTEIFVEFAFSEIAVQWN